MDDTDATPAQPAPGPGPEQHPDAPPTGPADLVGQLAAMTAKLWGVPTGTAARPALPAFPALPQIGTLSAQQVSAMVATVRAQRQSIAALRSQLDAFDENLAALEQLLEPLRSWTASWADLERGLRPPTGPADA